MTPRIPDVGAHDRIGEVFAAQSRQQGTLVCLGGGTHGCHFTDPSIILQGRRERLQERIDQRDVRWIEFRAGGRHQHQHPAQSALAAQRSDENVALDSRGHRLVDRQFRRDPVSTAAHLPLTRPPEQSLHLGWRADGSRVGHKMIGGSDAYGNGFETRSFEVESANQDLLKGQMFRQNGRDRQRGFANLDVAARLLPHAQQKMIVPVTIPVARLGDGRSIME